MINIIIAATQTLAREGMLAVLKNHKDICVKGTAPDAAILAKLLNVNNEYRPILVIDYSQGSPFNASQIRELSANHPIVVLTQLQNKADILELVNTGIKNIILKDCSGEEFIAAVYAANKGDNYFCPASSQILFGNKENPAQGKLSALSDREKEIIRLITDGCTNNDIAERLFLSVHTVKTHRKNIIKKLGLSFKNASDLLQLSEFINM